MEFQIFQKVTANVKLLCNVPLCYSSTQKELNKAMSGAKTNIFCFVCLVFVFFRRQ